MRMTSVPGKSQLKSTATGAYCSCWFVSEGNIEGPFVAKQREVLFELLRRDVHQVTAARQRILWFPRRTRDRDATGDGLEPIAANPDVLTRGPGGKRDG